jgi:hypothetical protein
VGTRGIATLRNGRTPSDRSFYRRFSSAGAHEHGRAPGTTVPSRNLARRLERLEAELAPRSDKPAPMIVVTYVGQPDRIIEVEGAEPAGDDRGSARQPFNPNVTSGGIHLHLCLHRTRERYRENDNSCDFTKCLHLRANCAELSQRRARQIRVERGWATKTQAKVRTPLGL